MKRRELENIQDAAAGSALRARERIEKAVDTGELPGWVMETFTVLERASMLYGVTSAQLKAQPPPTAVLHYDRAVVHH